MYVFTMELMQKWDKQKTLYGTTESNLCAVAIDLSKDQILLCWAQFPQRGQVAFLDSDACVHSLLANRGKTLRDTAGQILQSRCIGHFNF